MWRFLKRFHSDEDGAIALMFALFLVVLVGFAALAIDMGYSFATRTDLQVTASAAAHAGVQAITDVAPQDGIDDTKEYRRVAVEYAYRNMDETAHGNILHSDCGTYNPGTGIVTGDSDACTDVLVGNWDPDQRIFTPEGSLTVDMALDAVRVDAYRSVRSGNDNPLKLFLAPVVGLAEISIVVRAIAWNEGGDNPPEDCFQNGIISSGVVDMDSTNDFTEKFCVYGELGVSAQSDNCFEGEFDGQTVTCDASTPPVDGDVQVMKSEYGSWIEGGTNNDGFDLAKQPDQYLEPNIASDLYNYLQAVDAGFTSGTWSADPDYDLSFAESSQGASFCCSLPDPMASGGSYEVLGTADIPKGDWSNIAIKAKKITVSSDSTLDHVILLAEDEIDIGSDVVVTNSAFFSGFNSGEGLLKFGSDMTVGGPCGPVLNFAGYATGKLTVQSDTTFTNVQLATSYFQDVFDLQSDNVYVGVAIQSTGDVNLGSDNQFSGCPDGGGGGPETGPDAGLYVRLVE